MEAPSELIQNADLLFGGVVLLSILVMVISGIISPKWIYRTNADAHAMAPGLPISPAWAVGWFFVPIALLFKPYQAMAQTWRVSTRQPGTRKGDEPTLVQQWWALWIIGNVGSNVASRIGDEKSVQGIIYGHGALAASHALMIVMNLVFMTLVVRLTARQTKAWTAHQAAQSEPLAG